MTGRVPPYDGLSRQQLCKASPLPTPSVPSSHAAAPSTDKPYGMMGGAGILSLPGGIFTIRDVFLAKHPPSRTTAPARLCRHSLALFFFLLQPYRRSRPAELKERWNVRADLHSLCTYQGGDVTRKCGQRKAQIRSEICQGRKETEERPHLSSHPPITSTRHTKI